MRLRALIGHHKAICHPSIQDDSVIRRPHEGGARPELCPVAVFRKFKLPRLSVLGENPRNMRGNTLQRKRGVTPTPDHMTDLDRIYRPRPTGSPYGGRPG